MPEKGLVPSSNIIFQYPKFPLSCKIENRGDTNELEGRFMAAANIKIGDDTGAIAGHCIIAVLCP